LSIRVSAEIGNPSRRSSRKSAALNTFSADVVAVRSTATRIQFLAVAGGSGAEAVAGAASVAVT
jgi:hypothetical protein